MHHFKMAVALLALSLGGCAGEMAKIETTFTNVVDAVGNTTINRKDAYIAINVFNGIEKSVNKYIKLPQCGTMPCRIIGSATTLSQPFDAGISARNDLRAWMEANPGPIKDAGLYNALKAATASVQKIMTIYNIPAGGAK